MVMQFKGNNATTKRQEKEKRKNYEVRGQTNAGDLLNYFWSLLLSKVFDLIIQSGNIVNPFKQLKIILHIHFKQIYYIIYVFLLFVIIYNSTMAVLT